jgi:hypothetical protein
MAATTDKRKLPAISEKGQRFLIHAIVISTWVKYKFKNTLG